MIVITKGETNTIYFTGTENCSLTNPYFFFKFTNRITQQVIYALFENESLTARYDKATFDVNDYFEDADTGFWTYEIYETDDENVTSESGLNKIEDGYMYLNPATKFEPIKYNEQDNSFITYNG